LLDPKAMARLAVGEALTNLVWAKVTALSDVKASEERTVETFQIPPSLIYS
jgi:phosphoribosylformylglycinamidine (FGAM) synthase-like enzyme